LNASIRPQHAAAGCGLIVLLMAVFVGGFAAGRAGWQSPAAPGDGDLSPAAPTAAATEPATPPDPDTLLAPFWEAWDIVHARFVDQPLDDIALVRGAIQGMLAALGDEHTFYMDPEEYQQANIPLDGDYEGIGAWVDADTEFLTIVSPMPNSPAERAGLQPGDQIIAVDGEDMTGVDGNLVIRRVLGPAGSQVRLTIRREGEPDPFDVVLTRERIVVPSVEARMLESGVAYVQLLTFGTDTGPDLRASLENLMAQDPVGLVLDLRGNGGGYLNTAVEVASEFISEGTILIERSGAGEEQSYQASAGGVATDIPLVVLIDGGTASASEIVAGAIQDYERGVLVGETSFGKGSVQVWEPLRSDGGAVRVTTARWYTPLGRLIHGIGLTPDVEVIPPEGGAPPGTDPALDKAVEILTTAGS
jgi:carboxyl-terminal processing protease